MPTSVPTVAAAASASPFAHLVKAKKADDDDENMTDAESDPKDETDKDEKDGKKKGKKAKKAADDDKDKDAAADDDDKDASENDDGCDDADDKKKSSEYRAGERAGIKIGERRGEDLMQARIRAIMTSDVGLAHPAAAAQVAMETKTPAKDAIATLKAVAMMAPTGQRDALRDRMSTQAQPNIGGADTDNPSVNADGAVIATAAAIIAAGKKARGEK